MPKRITKNVIVSQSVGQVYQMWTEFDNFPSFMRNIKSVKKTGARSSHWVMKGPAGTHFEWDAATIVQEPNSRITWNSTSGDIDTGGDVTFESINPLQTKVTLTMTYGVPKSFGKKLAGLFINEEKMIEEDLKNFKKYAESTKRAA